MNKIWEKPTNVGNLGACTEASCNESKKKPSAKFIKILGASGLAIMMGVSVLCGVLIAPGNATNAETSNKSTIVTPQESGIISPQNDDPLMFTTEDGLEIKWGKAVVGGVENVTDQTAGTLNSGSLSGFPYFTTTDGTNTYTWVIIGRSSSGSYSTTALRYSHTDLLKNWQTMASNYNMIKYFFNSVYETTSPAGSSISSKLLNQYTTITKNVPVASTGFNISSLPAKAEIPSGCVLCLANDVTSSGVKSDQYVYDPDDSTPWCYSSEYANFTASAWDISLVNSDLCTAMNAIYNNGRLGLNLLKPHIVSVDLTTRALHFDDNLVKSVTTLTTSHYVYTLSGYSTDTFYYATYLTAAQAKLSSNWWLRGGSKGDWSYYPNDDYNTRAAHGDYINTSGALATKQVPTSAGYRPAFCLKIL